MFIIYPCDLTYFGECPFSNRSCKDCKPLEYQDPEDEDKN